MFPYLYIHCKTGSLWNSLWSWTSVNFLHPLLETSFGKMDSSQTEKVP